MMAVGGKRKQRWRQRTDMFRCPLPSPTLYSTPRHQRILSTPERRETLLPTFPLSSFFISSYLCLVVVCVRRRISTSVFLVFQKNFLHSLFSALPHNLVSAGFPVMKSPMFTLVIIHENNFFEEPLAFVSYLYVNVKKKKKEKKKIEKEKMKACCIYL